jgi:hypothetical protein
MSLEDEIRAQLWEAARQDPKLRNLVEAVDRGETPESDDVARDLLWPLVFARLSALEDAVLWLARHIDGSQSS